MNVRVDEPVLQDDCTCVTIWPSELMKLKQYKRHRMAERVDEAKTVYVPQDG